MQTILTTTGLREQDQYAFWCAAMTERFMRLNHRQLRRGPFHAELKIATVAKLTLFRAIADPFWSELTPSLIRKHDKQDSLYVQIGYGGRVFGLRGGQASILKPGDLKIIDPNIPGTIESPERFDTLTLELPRQMLEKALGPSRRYAEISIDGDLPSVCLVRAFFDELIRKHDTLGSDLAERMANIGLELIVASLAELLARETPRPLQGNLTVQRAKAYVQANLDDPTLDPPRLAAAMGLSLRRLHQLFHERGQHISDWIWERRLEAAANRLADPGFAHLQIGVLAHGCGFSSQSHFSKRFRDRYGVRPGCYRRAAFAALLQTTDATMNPSQPR